MPDLTASLRPNDRRLTCEPVVNSCGIPICAAVPPAASCDGAMADLRQRLETRTIERDCALRSLAAATDAAAAVASLREIDARPCPDMETRLTAQIEALCRVVLMLRAANAEQGACIKAFRALTFSNPPVAAAPMVDPIHRAIGAKPRQAIGLLTQ